jgi:hypothetical protein
MMALEIMRRVANTIKVQLTADISASAQIIPVTDASVFPAAPNFATLGEDNTAEVILYNSIHTGQDALTGCLRGQSGTVSKSWKEGAGVYHAWTAATANAMMDNIDALNGSKISRIDTETATDVAGLLKGDGATVSAAQAGVDYATPAVTRAHTLTVSDWDGNSYILADAAIKSASTPGDLRLSQAANADEYAAYAAARPQTTAQAAGSVTLTARGTVPAIDIPVILEVRA